MNHRSLSYTDCMLGVRALNLPRIAVFLHKGGKKVRKRMMFPFHWLALVSFALALPEKPPNSPSDLHGGSRDACGIIHQEASENAKTSNGKV